MVENDRAGWRSRTAGALAVLALIGLTTSCAGTPPNTITLYSGQHTQLTEALVSAFQAQTGIHVQIRTNDGIVLADQILQEGSRSPADVYFTENSPELTVLTEHHLLAQLPASITRQIPDVYNSPTGNWVGVALRVSALTYNPSRIAGTDLPRTLIDLARPQWKGKIALAPTDSDFVPLVGAVIATDGKAAASSWLHGLKTNAAIYQDDEAVTSAVNSGQAAVGIINQYYWYRLRLELGDRSTHSQLYYFPNQDIGSVENISGAAVLASSHHQAQADAFLSFLVSPAGQSILAKSDDFEYPARPDTPPNPALPPLSQVRPATINVVNLGDDQQAASLLQQSGLL